MDRCDCDMHEDDHHAWLWVAVAAGLALGVAGVVWYTRYRDPALSMERLLRRCQERITGIETSLSELEGAVGAAPTA